MAQNRWLEQGATSTKEFDEELRKILANQLSEIVVDVSVVKADGLNKLLSAYEKSSSLTSISLKKLNYLSEDKIKKFLYQLQIQAILRDNLSTLRLDVGKDLKRCTNQLLSVTQNFVDQQVEIHAVPSDAVGFYASALVNTFRTPNIKNLVLDIGLPASADDVWVARILETMQQRNLNEHQLNSLVIKDAYGSLDLCKLLEPEPKPQKVAAVPKVEVPSEPKKLSLAEIIAGMKSPPNKNFKRKLNRISVVAPVEEQKEAVNAYASSSAASSTSAITAALSSKEEQIESDRLFALSLQESEQPAEVKLPVASSPPKIESEAYLDAMMEELKAASEAQKSKDAKEQAEKDAVLNFFADAYLKGYIDEERIVYTNAFGKDMPSLESVLALVEKKKAQAKDHETSTSKLSR
jgi:hypothetical protein